MPNKQDFSMELKAAISRVEPLRATGVNVFKLPKETKTRYGSAPVGHNTVMLRNPNAPGLHAEESIE